jgi:hypothetical protein
MAFKLRGAPFRKETKYLDDKQSPSGSNESDTAVAEERAELIKGGASKKEVAAFDKYQAKRLVEIHGGG